VVLDTPGAISTHVEAAPPGQMVFSILGADELVERSGAGMGLVKAWRLTPANGGARLTLDLAGEAMIAHNFTIPPGRTDAGWRYVIDLAGGPAAAASRDAEVAEPATIAVAPPRTESKRRVARLVRPTAVSEPPSPEPSRREAIAHLDRKVVVIDAGHGGHDPGAQSSEADEKDITLAAALDLRRRLERTGRYRVVMTRATDVFVPLEERVRIARHAGADLFIALHADSAGADATPHGASVYTLSDHGEARVGQVLDGHEWFAKAQRRDAGVSKILLDLTQRTTLNRSSVFAAMLIAALSDKVDLLPRSHRDAGYFVLLAPDVPAVLLEMGFISSPVDEVRLTDPLQRRALMDAVSAAIDAYFAGSSQVAER
jgi:N-acetylmuramoyl-L-alanine amidase